MARDAALGDDDAILRHERGEAFGRRERRLEGLEVAVVDADEAAIELQRALGLGLVVHLGDGVHAEGCGLGGQHAGGRIIHGRHDDEDAVGAPGPGLGDLVAVDHEILAQGGEAGGGTGRRQELGCALERGAVREHGEARGAAGLVGLGERRRVEIRPDQPFGWARLFDFRDQREAAGRQFLREGSREWPHRPRGARPGDHVGQRAARGGGRHLFALVGDDLGENVAHACSGPFGSAPIATGGGGRWQSSLRYAKEIAGPGR